MFLDRASRLSLKSPVMPQLRDVAAPRARKVWRVPGPLGWGVQARGGGGTVISAWPRALGSALKGVETVALTSDRAPRTGRRGLGGMGLA